MEEGQSGAPVKTEEADPLDEIIIKKPKQTAEDKRRRNYIAVRKHRQQLKDTLEKCPVDLVNFEKEAKTLENDEEHYTSLVEMFRAMVDAVQERKKNEGIRLITEPGPSTSYRKRESPSENTTYELSPKQEFKRPKKMFSSGFPKELLPQTPLISPLYQSIYPQQQLTSLSLPSYFPNFVTSPLLQSPFVNPLVVQSAPVTPMQFSPLQAMYQLTPTSNLDLLQGSVATGPIQFTQDNIDQLWKLCNEQLR